MVASSIPAGARLSLKRPMSLAPCPSSSYESGRDDGLHFSTETPRIAAPLTGFLLEAASFLNQGRRLLFHSCLRGPRLEAAFCIHRRDLEQNTKASKDRSKYSSIFFGSLCVYDAS
ncbi:hypothetical protein NDU88_000275 [Pleurodeles waltl]|uniref:Uncharacterized protein n=1 Tax=Pleurodeles waltl TaxID=8319 RepID=A0AAV7VW04_PLEWA|nr:hypothetical protein NDU88_000275 [Pleurodeles waltl]